MRQRLVSCGMVVLLGLATGLTGCRPPVGALSSLGRAGAIGARGAARFGGMAGRTGPLKSVTALRSGVPSLGRAVPRLGPGEIDGVLGRGATSFPKGPIGGAPRLDPAVESGFARSLGPMTAEEGEAAWNAGMPRGWPSHPFDSRPPQFRQAGIGGPGPAGVAAGTESPALGARSLPQFPGRPVTGRAGILDGAVPRGFNEQESVGGHAAHLAPHLIHPHPERRDRDEQLEKRSKIHSSMDQTGPSRVGARR
jgi:hypothetical protein